MKKITVMGVMLLIVAISGCIETALDTEEPLLKINVTTWENLIGGERVNIEFNFTSDGLREAIDYCSDSHLVNIYLPSGNLTVSGIHRNNSVFCFDMNGWKIEGMGMNDTILYIDNVSDDVSIFTMNGKGCVFTDFQFFYNNSNFQPTALDILGRYNQVVKVRFNFNWNKHLLVDFIDNLDTNESLIIELENKTNKQWVIYSLNGMSYYDNNPFELR